MSDFLFDESKQPTKKDIYKAKLVEQRFCPNRHGPLVANLEGYNCDVCDFKLIIMIDEKQEYES